MLTFSPKFDDTRKNQGLTKRQFERQLNASLSIKVSFPKIRLFFTTMVLMNCIYNEYFIRAFGLKMKIGIFFFLAKKKRILDLFTSCNKYRSVKDKGCTPGKKPGIFISGREGKYQKEKE